MEHEIFNVKIHLVRITEEKPFGSNGTMKVTRNWEIMIADKDNETDKETTYQGTAVEHSMDFRIPWLELKGDKPLTEMIDLCKSKMK